MAISGQIFHTDTSPNIICTWYVQPRLQKLMLIHLLWEFV